MTSVPEHAPRRRGAAHAWARWATRVVLGCLFALGMLGTTSRSLVEAEAEPEPVVEIGEDGEVIARDVPQVRLVRRGAAHGGPWWARTHSERRPPRRVDPTVSAPTPPRWQRPRRAPLPDDDPSIG